MNSNTIVFCAVILVFGIWGWFDKKRTNLMSNITISLGMLGTFIGITYGLMGFDTENI